MSSPAQVPRFPVVPRNLTEPPEDEIVAGAADPIREGQSRARTPHRLVAVIYTLISLYPRAATTRELAVEIALCGYPQPRYGSLRRTLYGLWRIGVVQRIPGRPARYLFRRT